MPPASSLPDWFALAIQALQKNDIDGWMNIYAPEAVHEFPFAPAGGVNRLKGREAIATYMRQLPHLIHFGALTDVRAREAADELIIEAVGHHHRASDGAPRDIRYVWFITTQDSKVTHIRDYMNPLQLDALQK